MPTDYRTGTRCGFRGGEEAGLQQLREYLFVSHGAAHFKETRKHWMIRWRHPACHPGWPTATCRCEVTGMIDGYEQSDETIPPTGCGSSFVAGILLLVRHEARPVALPARWRTTAKPRQRLQSARFRERCQGTTPYPLVNAAMNQLRLTGYIHAGLGNWWPVTWSMNWPRTGVTAPPGLSSNWWTTMSPTSATGSTRRRGRRPVDCAGLIWTSRPASTILKGISWHAGKEA